jgi:hypothetical protein
MSASYPAAIVATTVDLPPAVAAALEDAVPRTGTHPAATTAALIRALASAGLAAGDTNDYQL